MSAKCKRCSGTGYASCARDAHMQDAHWLDIPYGVFKCPDCDGRGKEWECPKIELDKETIEKCEAIIKDAQAKGWL